MFVNKRRCQMNCFGRLPDNTVGGIARGEFCIVKESGL